MGLSRITTLTPFFLVS